MITIEQVRLLESRVVKTIEYVDRVSEENTLLKNKLDACQKRVDELEVLIQRFKEDQLKIEEGIISALDRLNKFEDEMSSSRAAVHSATSAAVHSAPAASHSAPAQEAARAEAARPARPAIPRNDAPADLGGVDDISLEENALPAPGGSGTGAAASGGLEIF